LAGSHPLKRARDRAFASDLNEERQAKKAKNAKRKAAKTILKKRARTAKTKAPKATAPGWTPSSGDPSGEGQGFDLKEDRCR